jgi:hypothetical protein
MVFVSERISKLTQFSALALLAILHSQYLFAGDIVLRVEEPQAGSIMTGVSNIRGWAVGSSGIDRIELYMDGEYRTDIPLGGSRKDVGAAYPQFPDSDKSGYSMANNYSTKSAGSHVITIKAFDNDGAVNEVDVPYTVTRFDDSYIKKSDDISILEVTDIVINGGRSLTMEGVDVQGEKQDIRLDWQTPKQNFSITSILPSEQASDGPLEGVYSLSRLTMWFGQLPDLPDGLILDTEAESRVVEGVPISMAASGKLTVSGPEMVMRMNITLITDEFSDSFQDQSEATIIADHGYAIDYRDPFGTYTGVLLQRGSHLIWLEYLYDDPDGENGVMVMQWQRLSDSATRQFNEADLADSAHTSLSGAVLQAVRKVLYATAQ